MVIFESKEINLEETNYRELIAIDEGVNAINLHNDSGVHIDGDSLAEHLAHVEGIEGIQSLSVKFSSKLLDVKVIRGLPGLTRLHVNGHRIQTLDGLESFRSGQHLDIVTGSNRKRRIANIAQAPINNLTLEYARVEDFMDIGLSTTIRKLQLSGSPSPDFQDWSSVPLESLFFSKGKFSELLDTGHVQSLEKLTLIGCRNLERFVGDHSGINKLLVDNCKRLDVRTVAAFRRLESLTLNGSSQRLSLTDFVVNEQLQSLNLLNCEVDVNIDDLKSFLPRLEKLHISKLKKEQILSLREQNPSVAINMGL
ncbi:hypothetical protein K0T92_14195 [Paenibacillus oenotherae]|uniref:Uncharacterized protein n=1 Tax=Paenibacillus oenotherae TaxID=1435645 RepID=A0ABS7D7G9_9BACL|nr:hypothetical protein [Paenibacillus oenotherae]MBW7475893.1 hypothetical protein [Paenibacillus oenotherae]